LRRTTLSAFGKTTTLKERIVERTKRRKKKGKRGDSHPPLEHSKRARKYRLLLKKNVWQGSIGQRRGISKPKMSPSTLKKDWPRSPHGCGKKEKRSILRKKQAGIAGEGEELFTNLGERAEPYISALTRPRGKGEKRTRREERYASREEIGL